jgi:hypothetical protein
MAAVMMWSLVTGQMSGHLYIDRIKRDRRAKEGKPEDRSMATNNEKSFIEAIKVIIDY